MLERRVVDIYAYDLLKPTICLTYIIKVDTDKLEVYIQDLKCWVREDVLEDYRILFVAYQLMRNIRNRKDTKERSVFIEYQKLAKKELWKTYRIRTEKFNTERLANTRKPYREFELVTEEELDKKIVGGITDE